MEHSCTLITNDFPFLFIYASIARYDSSWLHSHFHLKFPFAIFITLHRLGLSVWDHILVLPFVVCPPFWSTHMLSHLLAWLTFAEYSRVICNRLFWPLHSCEKNNQTRLLRSVVSSNPPSRCDCHITAGICRTAIGVLNGIEAAQVWRGLSYLY